MFLQQPIHTYTDQHTLTTRRTNDYPFADDGCLQYLLKGARHRKNRHGVVTRLRLHQNEINAVKHYEERFEDGPDLQDRRYERPLERAQLH